MIYFFRPLRDRRAWIAGGATALVAITLLLLFGSSRMHEHGRLVSGILLGSAMGFIVAGTVLILRQNHPAQPGGTLVALDTGERKAVRRAFAYGDPTRLPPSVRPHAVPFARLYLTQQPKRTAPLLVLNVGILLEALSQLRTWDGGLIASFLVLEFVAVGFVLLAVMPLQLRQLARVARYVSDDGDSWRTSRRAKRAAGKRS